MDSPHVGRKHVALAEGKASFRPHSDPDSAVTALASSAKMRNPTAAFVSHIRCANMHECPQQG